MKIDRQLMLKTADNKKKNPTKMPAEFCVSVIWLKK